MAQVARKTNRNMVNLLLDGTIFVAFLASTAPRFTGLAIHEWLSIAFGAAIVTHLLLHWSWIVAVTKRFFGKAQWSARVNYVLNALLFVAFTVIIFTGLMISEVALPFIGIQLAGGHLWEQLHKLAADASVFLIGLHVALHWQWIVNMLKRIIVAPRWPRRAAQPTISNQQQEA
ncbi:MAG: DUF4405 domain-containing protein [Chloroflexales bacterium]|nr:DUF4405 domain-containing protein [Chloroflexales bacterium]